MPSDPIHIISAATHDGKINPHGGKELALMLDGTKPMAMFGQTWDMARDDVGDRDFERFVIDGSLVYLGVHYPSENYTRHYYALPDESWRIKAMHALQGEGASAVFPSFTRDDYYRMVGFLLGYTKEDIEAFVTRTSERRRSFDHNDRD